MVFRKKERFVGEIETGKNMQLFTTSREVSRQKNRLRKCLLLLNFWLLKDLIYIKKCSITNRIIKFHHRICVCIFPLHRCFDLQSILSTCSKTIEWKGWKQTIDCCCIFYKHSMGLQMCFYRRNLQLVLLFKRTEKDIFYKHLGLC